MKLTLVNVEDGIVSAGFRKMASHVRSYHPDVAIRYVTPGRRSLKEHLFPSNAGESDAFCRAIADELTGADVVGFSSMSIHAVTVAGIISHLRRASPSTFVVWGGCHGVLEPEAAIQHADAVCTGRASPPSASSWKPTGTAVITRIRAISGSAKVRTS